MANPKTTATLIAVVAVILAGIAAYLVYGYLAGKELETQQAKLDVAQIVVASKDIAYGTQLKLDQMKVVDWPKSNLPPGHASDPELLKGRITVATIKANSPIIAAQLAPADTVGGIMPYLIPEGKRAVTVAVNEVVGVAGFVLPNSIVDVVATLNSPYTKGFDARIAKIVLQQVKVLAVGQILEQQEGKPVVVPTVTLEVSPDDAEKLILAAENRVQLILRHMGDEAESKTRGATVSSLLGGAPPAPVRTGGGGGGARRASAPAPEKSSYVELIKGPERSKIKMQAK